jgi:hypothetical protein
MFAAVAEIVGKGTTLSRSDSPPLNRSCVRRGFEGEGFSGAVSWSNLLGVPGADVLLLEGGGVDNRGFLLEGMSLLVETPPDGSGDEDALRFLLEGVVTAPRSESESSTSMML